MKLVCIHWIDSCSTDDWTDLDEIDLNPAEVISVGIVIKEDEHGFILATNIDTSNKHASCLMRITLSSIVKVITLGGINDKLSYKNMVQTGKPIRSKA
jgi:hypothetical protein